MDYLCPLPWLHLSVHYDGSLRVCCNGAEGRELTHYDGKKIYFKNCNDSNSFLNSPTLQGVRKDMLKGVTPKMCQGCDAIDQNGGASPGKLYSVQFKDELKPLLDLTDKSGFLRETQPPLYVDFTFGNFCNLQCRMCAPEFSTAMFKEWNDLGIPYDSEGEQLARINWNDTPEFSSLLRSVTSKSQVLLLQGGEPLFNNKILKLLEYLVAHDFARGISLKITTNLTHLPKKILDTLVHFKGVAIHPSLEGWGDVNDYIRFPSNFEIIKKNLDQLVILGKMMPLYINVLTVFQSMNVFGIPEMLEKMKLYSKSIPAIPRFSYLNWPDYLCAHHLPSTLKARALSKLNKYLDENKDFYATCGETTQSNLETLKSCMKLMEQNGRSEKFDEFLDFMKSLDASRLERGQKRMLGDLFPEFFLSREES